MSESSDVSSTPNSTALVIGDQVFFQALFADTKAFVFSREQMQFLGALQEFKNLEAACNTTQKSINWAQNFLSSRKFRAFRNAKLMESSIRNGITIEWWYQFGKYVSQGFREYWTGTCEICHEDVEFSAYEIESFRDDDMRLRAKCPVCFQDVQVECKQEKFHPTREQVVAWQELGARLVPKIERVQHEFEREDFVFKTEEAG